MAHDHEKAFRYRIPWRTKSMHLGDHRGTERGLGFEYRGNLPFVEYPDARRMDFRQSVRDPFEQVQVKLFNQDNTTPVYAVCDLSSSMQYGSNPRKLDSAIAIAESVAYSAWQAGDVFSLVSYHDQVDEAYSQPLSHHLASSLDLLAELRQFRRMQMGARGALEVSQYLSQQRGLVFWISDFHMPLHLIEETLNSLSRHQLVPVVLWDEAEFSKLPKFGIGNMLDPETGAMRTVFFRDYVRKQFMAAFAQRKTALEQLFLQFDSQPLFLSESFTPDVMTRYFDQYVSL
ncbi:DUF58 domain-containing protein [Methylovorus sp. MP688]|uniref:DUF58 domain-containing protein n=1 Tax=Methylovorus sp. (strain MP688) TaxID=887061 RepID=UPI0001EC48A6|nr:DUF58 domain-containing protein [Methylovorus sp. MP688]ADQ85773.1 conserved hypothetical protein [Methylovorus sp. MP688]